MQMDYRKLTERYFEGQTSEQEEAELKAWALGQQAQQEAMPLADYFRSLEPTVHKLPESFANRLERSIDEWSRVEHAAEHRTRTASLRWAVGMAAAFALVFSIGTALNLREDRNSSYATIDTYDNPQDAYQETQRALQTFSLAINKGFNAIDKKQNDK